MSNNSYAAEEELSVDSVRSEGTMGSGIHVRQEEDTEARNLAKTETKAVKYARAVVVAFLIVAAVLVSIAVYFYTRGEEKDEFKETFDDGSTRIIGAFYEYTDSKLKAISSFGVSFTSRAIFSNSTWPRVTLPHFEIRGASALSLADSSFLMFAPLVAEEDRDRWEQYSVENQGWITEGLEYRQEQMARTHRNMQELNFDQGIANRIFKRTDSGEVVAEEGPGPYSPLWQMTPVIDGSAYTVNFNSFSSDLFGSGLTTLVDTKQAVITEVFNTQADVASGSADALSVYLEQSNPSFQGDPVSTLKYPVFDRFGEGRELVGSLTSDIHWLSFFTGILPPQAEGFICVLENECGQAFTYGIYGQEAEYLGEGDLHDTSYDGMERSTSFAAFSEKVEDGITTYNDAALNQDYCSYTLRIYPSTTLEDKYVTTMPLIYTIGVILTFFFTTVVIITYDCIVERRQRLVMESAVRSDMIVSSLFPKTFRDRLYQGDEEKTGENQEQPLPAPLIDNKMKFQHAGVPKLQMAKFLNDGVSTVEEKDELTNSKPIADLFPETTVLFADLAGFTAWSSGRSPADVFTLLETIYGGFDAIARRRGVFKVETIGDCYVAVTGLPNPDPDHAANMARFARDCLVEMDRLVEKLAKSLGEETKNLAMRVGIHSGPVTAGVLRGERFRFQLFGDTVNVAAKMENKGQRKRIHASSDTANLLRDAGKSHWVKAREDQPGMQTFWVEPTSAYASSSTGGSERSLSDTASTSGGTGPSS